MHDTDGDGYTPEIHDKLIERLMLGRSLLSICRDDAARARRSEDQARGEGGERVSSIDKHIKAVTAWHSATRKGRPRERKPVSMPSQPTQWDMGANGPANRRGLKQEDAMEQDPVTGKTSNPNGVKRMRRVDMLERWHRKGQISAAGYTAACALRDAFEATGRTTSVDPTQDRVDSSPKPDHAAEIQIDRVSRFHAINRHVAAEDRAIIDACILSGGTPASLRQYRGRMHSAGMIHLSEALDRLAYCMGQSAGRYPSR